MIRQLIDLLKGSLYAFLSLFFLLVGKLLFHLQVSGRPRLGGSNGYIVVARHRSYWDVPLLTAAAGWRNRIHYIARAKLRRNKLFRPLLRLYATTIERDRFGKADFRRMLKALKSERLIGIFPEGTTVKRVDPKSGAVRFALLTGKDLLPVRIATTGPYPPIYPFGFPRMSISFGEPLCATDLEKEIPGVSTRRERYRLLTEKLMERVDAG